MMRIYLDYYTRQVIMYLRKPPGKANNLRHPRHLRLKKMKEDNMKQPYFHNFYYLPLFKINGKYSSQFIYLCFWQINDKSGWALHETYEAMTQQGYILHFPRIIV